MAVCKLWILYVLYILFPSRMVKISDTMVDCDPHTLPNSEINSAIFTRKYMIHEHLHQCNIENIYEDYLIISWLSSNDLII